MKFEFKDENSRIVFAKNKQKELIEKVKENSNLTWREISNELGISELSLRNDLRNEKYLISYKNFRKICNLGKIKPKEYFKFIQEIKERNWGMIKGGQIGGRKKKPNISKIKIKTPKISQNLTEFLGILLGDGSISKTNYCIEIALNKESDKLYADYVYDLIFNLFGIISHKISVKDKKIIKLRINSKELFKFIEKLEMPIGQETKNIPSWVAKDKNLIIGILRGLFDTDGSMFYSSRRCIVNLSCYSTTMRKQVQSFLNMFEIPTSITKNNLNASSLWKIKKFMKIIGTSNVKNIIKFSEYINNKKTIRTEDLKEYFDLYRTITVPFKYREGHLAWSK